MDRKNNKLYCVGGNQIRQSNLDFSSGVTRALTSITGITSCEVQDSENIFITTANSLYHYDWDNNTTEISPLTGLDTAFDVQVRPPYIYVANSQNASGQQVLQLTHDYSSGTFNIVASYGTQTGSTDTNPGMFYGAHRFIAIRNDSLIIADSHDSSEPRLSKLVSFTNMSGLGWATYGEYGTGNGQFKIYNYC
ncbi:MAG: hypothetical protein A2176_04900 [Spirochaetes bacterium RBG_13_51_14]|nr:MAG: hypothetical protein A2176_04900 [Spirochaetes bacterium RBG_13_51_14]